MFEWIQRRRKERKLLEEEEREKAQVEFDAKLENPQFQEIERFFGRPISLSLRSLYEDKTEIRKSYITKIVPGAPEDEWIFISSYWPLDKEQTEA